MKRQLTTAFSLVEVTIALGVIAVGLIAVFGLLPIGVNSNQASIQQTATSAILTAISEDLRATPKTENRSFLFKIRIPEGDTLYFKESGTVDVPGNSRYRASVSFTPSSNRLATTGRILLAWPAQQDDTSNAKGTIEAFVALDRN